MNYLITTVYINIKKAQKLQKPLTTLQHYNKQK